MRRRARERRTHGRNTPRELRQDFVAQPVPREPRIVVTLVVDPHEPVRDRVAFDSGARTPIIGRRIRGRPPPRHRSRFIGSRERHPGKPLHARAAQQLQQNRFGLIVEVVREHDAIGACGAQGRVARFTRGAFETVTARDAHIDDPAGDAKRSRRAAAERGPRLRIRAEVVIHVDGAQFEPQRIAQRGEHMQQDGRIDAAAQTQHEPLTRAHEILQPISHMFDEVVRRATSIRLP